jgi:hypothetical protein
MSTPDEVRSLEDTLLAEIKWEAQKQFALFAAPTAVLTYAALKLPVLQRNPAMKTHRKLFLLTALPCLVGYHFGVTPLVNDGFTRVMELPQSSKQREDLKNGYV